MNKIFALSLNSAVFIFLCACSDKPKEQSSAPTDKQEERPSTPHPASKHAVEMKKADWEYLTTLKDSLLSDDRPRILQAFSEYGQKSNAGFHMDLVVTTVMKNGTAEQRALVDDILIALCKVAEGSETTELNKAHAFLVGATQTAFEVARESGPRSIPPAKNVLDWWKSSKARALLVAK